MAAVRQPSGRGRRTTARTHWATRVGSYSIRSPAGQVGPAFFKCARSRFLAETVFLTTTVRAARKLGLKNVDPDIQETHYGYRVFKVSP